MLRALGWIVVVVLLAAAAFELALALGFQSGRVSGGEQARGEVTASLAALIAILAGAAVAVANARRPTRVAALFAPAAGAYLAAFFFTYDPYYAPGLERYSEREVVGWPWLFGLVGVAVAAGVLTWIRPRVGSLATSVVLLLLLFMTVAVADGH